jgi:nucleotide-binding universal stress UspA family protein
MFMKGKPMSALYKKILVPLDGSALARQALPHAEEIARGTDARIILVRVIDQPMHIGAIPGMGNAGASSGVGNGAIGVIDAIIDDAAHRQALDDAEAALAALLPDLHYRKVNAVAEVLTGDPAMQIVDYARANDVDLIVMSTHGRSGLARWRFGSVAHMVLQEAPCAVVVVRPSLAQRGPAR